MRILGIDPGYGILGWAVIESDRTVHQYGTIETEKEKPLGDRLLDIHRGINYIIETFQPETVALEKLFFSRNTTTALDVARAIGVVILTIQMAGLEYSEYTPTQIKQAVTGYGKADKGQIQGMVKTLFGLKNIPKPDDAADALAIAACHSFSL